jgi:hypothetical protein
MQRNTVTLVYDVDAATYREIATPFARVAFAKNSDVVFAATADNELSALDLATLTPRWSIATPSTLSLLRIADDDGTILLGDGSGVQVIDAATGSVRGTVLAQNAAYATFVPGGKSALVVGHTVWRDKGPHTPVYVVDLATGSTDVPVDVPNCEAPIAVLPNASRAFLSPTYCSPGAQAVPGETWTNPDPVSVIDLAASGSASFVKNLPGFGPVVMAKDGSKVVAYLDVQRMDPKMFDDQSQVPWKDGQRYYLMTINPQSLSFQLAPIGNAIPRFALTADGRGLLVDASQKFTSRTKIAAKATVTVGPDGVEGSVETNLDIFGSSSAFGYFDLATQSYSSFNGPNAPLDRFVQLADGRILTLARRTDGLGGIPYMIDVATKQTWAVQGNFGSGVRDVGLSYDGVSVFVRLRLSADIHDGGFYSREGMCVSTDGSCGVSLIASYEATVPFAVVAPQAPPDECPPGGHDCF